MKLHIGPIKRLDDGSLVPLSSGQESEESHRATMAGRVLAAHTVSKEGRLLRLRFDMMASPDNNYTSILQEVMAMRCEKFSLPWVFTNGHNAMACTGGSINNDDHAFCYDCVRKFGGIYVPPYQGIIHQFVRERMAAGGNMVLASDSHARYGCLGTMGIGEGGTELAKHAMGGTYDLRSPEVVAVNLHGRMPEYCGPMDLALTVIGKTFKKGVLKNKVVEVIGPGIGTLSIESRFSFDAMFSEAGCLSTIWETDGATRAWFAENGREEDFLEMHPGTGAVYDGYIDICLDEVEPMIAMPFHPSNTFSIRSLCDDVDYLMDVLASVEREAADKSGGLAFTLRDKVRGSRLYAQQASIAGCVGGTFENISAAAQILAGHVVDSASIPLGVYPASQAVMSKLEKKGALGSLIRSGVAIHPCICGPCFGTTDVPANNSLAIRHVTRNFYSREGTRPDQGQLSACAIMDARSIAATVRNGGRLTSAAELATIEGDLNAPVRTSPVYFGYGSPQEVSSIRRGPNIADWPPIPRLGEHLLLEVAGSFEGSVTTDELCPSGEASSLRSNPFKIAEYTMISKDREYKARAKSFRDMDENRKSTLLAEGAKILSFNPSDVSLGTALAAGSIGDGSSREQSVSNQKILGGWANISMDYATKRYRSNCVNWGVVPFLLNEGMALPSVGDLIFVPYVREAILEGKGSVTAYFLNKSGSIELAIPTLSAEEAQILAAGGLINYYMA